MEITGIECSHKKCDERLWSHHPDFERDFAEWLTVEMHSDAYDFHAVAHYCKQHGRGLVEMTAYTHVNGPHSGQERVLADVDDTVIDDTVAENTQELTAAEMGAQLAAALDDQNDADLAKAGFAQSRDWTPARGNPLLHRAGADIEIPVGVVDIGQLEPTEEAPIPHDAGRAIKVRKGGSRTNGRPQAAPRKTARNGRVGSTVKNAVITLALLSVSILTKRHA